MTEFLIGADPELFVKKNGKLVSAHGLIPGNKHAPFVVDGGAVQVDGMALEFNINPASTAKEFNNNINKVLGHLKQMVGPDYEFDFSPVATFGQDYIDDQPAEAKELGCDPDFNAYTNVINPKPNANLGIRTASGHIHIGWTSDQDVNDPDHIEACQMVTKQLDITLGLACKIWDRDEVRSQMYGKLGTYRVKPYGVEYRTPSNIWVKDVITRRLVFNIALSAVGRLLEGKRIYDNYSPLDLEEWSYSDKWLMFKEIGKNSLKLDSTDISDMANIKDSLTNNPYVKTNKYRGKSRFSEVSIPASVWNIDFADDIQQVEFPAPIDDELLLEQGF